MARAPTNDTTPNAPARRRNMHPITFVTASMAALQLSAFAETPHVEASSNSLGRR